jgi:hypothetical protein
VEARFSNMVNIFPIIKAEGIRQMLNVVRTVT